MVYPTDTVLYMRYSDKNQQELSIEGQMRVCTDYCGKNNYNIVDTYIDRAVSGRTETRENFQRMVKDAEKGLFKIIVVYKLNRFFRDRLEAAIYRKELRNHGVKLLSATEDIPEGRGGIYYEAILEADAEVRSMEISEDTMRGMYDAAKNCQVTGAVPYGYMSVPITGNPKDKGRKMEIHPSEATVVRRAFEMYAEGYSMADISRTFTNEGIRTRANKPFRVSTLSQMYKNVKYMGMYKYKDEITIEGGCPAIIDATLFAEVNRIISSSKQAPARGKATEEFFLTTKLYCGKCDKPMFGDSANKKGKRYYYYSCTSRRKFKTCDKQPVPKNIIENAVLNGALNALTPENIAIIATEAQQIALEESDNAQLINSLENELAAVNREIENISKAITMGIITETTKDLLINAERRRSDLKGRIVREQILSSQTITAEGVASFLKKFVNGNRNDVEFKRAVYDLLVHKVYVYDNDGGKGDGYIVIWCNVGKGFEIKVDLFGYATNRGAKHRVKLIILLCVFLPFFKVLLAY